MAMDPQVMNLFIMLFAVVGIESLLLMFIVFKTPAMTFLSASMFGKRVMYIIGKDHIGQWATFKVVHGAAKLGKHGIYNVTENSHTLDAKSKIPIYFAFRDMAATMFPEYPAFVQEVRETGVLLNNLDDCDRLLAEIYKGLSGDFPVNVRSFKTYRFHDLANMYPYNLDPSFIDATVQSEISKGLKTIKMTPAIVTGVAILIIVAAVAFFILNKAFKGSITVDECNALVSTSKCSADVINAAVSAATGGRLG